MPRGRTNKRTEKALSESSAPRLARPSSSPSATLVAELPPEESKEQSMTAIAGEAGRTGVVAGPPEVDPEIPEPEGALLQAGDPDVSPLFNEMSGEDSPGADTPTPDQNQVDEIGRAYGLQEEDDGPLRTASEILDRRDRHRED
jgi:Family of unknown function (DUF6335)